MDKETITLAIAVTGAVTGILGLIFNFLNTWRAFDRDRIKLKVVPRWAMRLHPSTGSEQMLCVEIVNLGFTPATLSAVLFSLRDGKNELHFLPDPLTAVKLPARLEARESVAIYARPGLEHSPEFRKVARARARTACGRVFDGTSPALKAWVKKLRQQGPE